MILHNDVMANGLNPNSSGIQVNSLVNRRLKLPPIATSCNDVKQHDNRSSNTGRNRDLKAIQDFSLPRMISNTLGPENSHDENKIIPDKSVEDPAFPLSRVYTVLPPIGEKCVPSTSAPRRTANGINIPNAPSGIRQHNRSTRKRIMKLNQLHNAGVENDSTPKDNVSKSVTVGESIALIKTADSGNAERFCIDIPDSELPMIEIDLAPNQNITEPYPTDNSKSDSGKQCGEMQPTLGSDSIYTTISEPVTIDEGYSDNEQGPETPFPQFSTVPEDLSFYADVYPLSPPPGERRAKMNVEKTRQLLVEENGFRVAFMQEFGHKRRNATCVEIDDALKNAVKLLRDLFLRKTMEELCMLW